MPAPVNDLCANATVISSLPYSVSAYDVSLATTSTDDPKPAALDYAGGPGSGNGLAGQVAAARTVWWVYTSPSNQTVEITSDQYFSVYIGSCGSFTEIFSWYTKGTLRLAAGITYYIMVGEDSSFLAATINFSIATSTKPYNQSMYTAIDIGTLPYSATISSVNTDDTDTNHTLWYKYTADDNSAFNFFPYDVPTCK